MKIHNNKTIAVTILLLTFLLLQACDNKHDDHESEIHMDELETHAEEVELTDKEIAEFGIQLEQAGSGDIQTHVSLPGEIIIPPDNLAHLHPRFPGVVKEVFKHIGDYVNKGETLAIIEGNESLSDYEVKSMIDGMIIEKHLTLGEVIDDADHGFLIADIRTVWAKLSLYQKDLPYVKVGQRVQLSAGVDMPEYTGRIDFISPIIDEVTRTASARVIVPNLPGVWKPGLFVNGRVTTETRTVSIAVPKTAIEFYEDEKVVFVFDGDGFAPRPVTLGLSNDNNVQVISGLEAGETYVSRGGFTLKAELQKSEMDDDDHGH